MEIQVWADRPLRAEDELVSLVGTELVAGLGPCAGRVTSACVHVTTDWGFHGPALRCLLEVRPLGHAPLAVTHHASTHDAAVRGAVGDMRGLLDRMFRRIDAAGTAETVRHPA